MSEKTIGQRVVEKWREDWRGLHLPPSGTSCTDLAARFDAELAKITDRTRSLESIIRRNWNKFSHEDHAELERMGVRWGLS